MRKKIKKVIKGLQKASKTHAKQAKVLKSGLKVFKARGGMDMGAGSSGMGSGKSSNQGSDHGHSRFEPGSGYYGGTKKTSPSGGGGGGPKKPPKTTTGGGDVPFKPPLNFAQSTALGMIVPFSGTAINTAAKLNYKGRQKYAKKQGLYRDYYKTTGTNLQPNSPKGKEYLKDAGYGKTTPTVADNDGPPPILPIKPKPASVNEPLDSVDSAYKKPTVVDGVFNYSVGLKKGGMLRQGKPKLAKKGWK